MKNLIKLLLHRVLGFKNYLFSFGLFKIFTIRWDKKENDFFYFLNLLPDKSFVLDVGANIGIMSIIMAKTLKNSQVLAFEPIPVNRNIMIKLIRFFKLKNINLLGFALGNENKKVLMVMPVVQSVKMQGLSHILHESIKENNEGLTFEAEMRKLDDIQEVNSLVNPISGIKIDIENFEYFALEGARETIKKHKPIIYIELWDNENRQKCFKLIKELGYDIKVIAGKKAVPYDPNHHITQNFIFQAA
jgi:FkbM family methyltransferase